MDRSTNAYNNSSYYQRIYGSSLNDLREAEDFYRKCDEEIIERLYPQTVMDVGCSIGMMVSAFRDIGIECYGIDISEFAISQTRIEHRSYFSVQDILDPIPEHFPQHYDVVTCIEVAEHLPEAIIRKFIGRLCELGSYVVFSSTPYDIEDPTHINVQQPEYWCKLFAEQGYYRCLDKEFELPTKWTMCFCAKNVTFASLVEDYERCSRIDKTKWKKQIQDYSDLIAYERKAHEEQVKEYDSLVGWERTTYSKEIESLRQLCNQFESMYLEINSALWWRITKPGRMVTGTVRRIVHCCARIIRLDKSKKAFQILKREGIRGLINAILRKMKAPKKGSMSEMIMKSVVPAYMDASVQESLSVATLYRDTGNPVHAIPTVYSNEKVKRLNLVTDTIESNSLLGGVATALIVATRFCTEYGYELRIITRNALPVPMNYENILRINNLERPTRVSYYSDFTGVLGQEPKYKMDITETDIFYATSWWSAEAIRRTTLRKRFFYIIQEAETFFYHFGGERVMCESLMHDPNIDYIINSHFLNEYFREHETNVYENGVYFEPAFSKELYYPAEEKRLTDKHRLFFYGRPHNPRNLFNYGVNVLDEAIRQGIIDTNKWEICFAGANIKPITFCDGSKSVSMGQMSWEEYAAFLREVDLALCLMYTPHPSYPPFDVACSGGVVVSNKYMTKQAFPQSDNVLMADLTMESLLEHLNKGIVLALDSERRKANYEKMTIPRNWNDTLGDVLRFMEEHADGEH